VASLCPMKESSGSWRATSARLLLVSSGYGNRLGRVVVVLTELSPLSVLPTMLLLVCGGGIGASILIEGTLCPTLAGAGNDDNFRCRIHC
jgi:hypothetical protein